MKQRDVFWFWLPLFASWLMMTAEGPIVSAAINRLPDEVIMLAAQGIIVSLSVTIESPIINLLATSTALVKDRSSFLLMRRFTIHWMIFLTAVTIIIAFTPVFDLVVRRGLGAPEEIAVWVQPGLKIMTFWSAAIAWRRFLQGLLIHFNMPRKMAWGTAVRLVVSGGVVIGLAKFTQLPGAYIGSIALMVGVVAEAIYATIAVRPLLQNELSVNAPLSTDAPLTYRDLFWFHLPLAGTSLLILLVQPMVAFTLARLDKPVESLAAWPLVFQIMLMARAAAFALPEAVISLTKGPETIRPVRRFTLNLAAVLTGLMALLIISPLASYYIFTVQDMTRSVGNLALSSLPYFAILPALTAVSVWLRGLLITRRVTNDVNIGMFINMGVTAVTLSVGLSFQLPGLPTAAIALNIAAVCEIMYLAWRTQRYFPIGLPMRLIVEN